MEIATEVKSVDGVVRIGNGAKLHPATKDEKNHLWILCSCAGTQQGSAYNRARFIPNATPNCKN